MAFRDFEYPEVVTTFSLTEVTADLFGSAPPVPLSAAYQAIGPRFARLAHLNPTEKAKSEFLIAPFLSELWARYEDRISLHSGWELAADAEAGLTGPCDFVFGRGYQLPRLISPEVVVVSAERNDLMLGVGPCIASMVGIQRMKRAVPEAPVFGLITTGRLWKIKRLSGSVVYHDSQTYGLNQPERLLGALVAMIESLLAVPT